MKRMFVYILTNRTQTVIYIGVTNNLKRRLCEHVENAGKRESFTGRNYCNQLIYFEEFDGPNAAIKREKQIKGWTRTKKFDLIKAKNPGLGVVDPP